MHPALLGRARLSWSTAGAVNVVTDGNSIVIQGGGAVGVMMGSAPFSAHTLTNVAANGQTVAGMASNTSDVRAAHVAGRQNVLTAQEFTNSIGTGETPGTAVDQMLAYFAAEKAAKAWACTVAFTAPPAYNGDTYPQSYVDAYNANIDEANRLLRLRYREAIDVLIDLRALGMPFDATRYPNYLRATFYDSAVVNGFSNTSMFLDESTQRVHYTDACRARLAALLAPKFLQLPRAR